MSSPAATTGSPGQAPRRLGDLVASSVTRGAGILILATLGWAVAYLVGPTRGRLFVLGAALVGLWGSVAIVVSDPERFLAGLFPINVLYLPFLLLFSGFGFQDEYDRPSFVGLAVTSLLIAAAYLLVSRHLDRTGRRGAGTAFVAVGIGVLAQGL